MPALRPLQTETFDNCSVATILPDDDQQAEFARQLDLLIVQQRPFTSIFSWIVYNEGWGQITSYYPEFGLTDRVKQLDPTRLVDSTTGWYDHGAGDYSVCCPLSCVIYSSLTILGQSSLRKSTVRLAFLLHPVDTLRPDPHWHSGRVWRHW